MGHLMHLANRRGIAVVEDAAEALSATWRGRQAGTFGVTAAFSFYANKTITTGEGGMVVTHQRSLADQMRRLRAQGVDTTDHQYYHSVLGYNYRMTNLQAAVGCGQMEGLDYFLKQRARAVDFYRHALRDLQQQYLFPEATASDWMYSVLLPENVDIECVRNRMLSAGVETRPMFLPLSKLPMYETDETFPAAEAISSRGLSLPTHAGLTAEMTEHVVAVLRTALQEATK
jgi:perosamine synthetase